MMRPLREEKKAKDRVARRAAQLLAQAAPEAREAPPWMKQRVRARLEASERARRRAWLMQAAAAALVLMLATAAAAGIGRRWIERHLLGRDPGAAGPASPVVTAPVATREATPAPVSAMVPLAPPIMSAPSMESPVRAEKIAAPAPVVRAPGKAGRGGGAMPAPPAKSTAPATPAAAAAAPASAPSGTDDPKALAPAPRPAPRSAGGVAAKTSLDDDEAPAAALQQRRQAEAAKLVTDAMMALRQARDPARAGELLDRYLKEYPHGELEEQVLALAVEAAAARGDATAARYAATYLKRYPDGRFAEAARRAIARFAR